MWESCKVALIGMRTKLIVHERNQQTPTGSRGKVVIKINSSNQIGLNFTTLNQVKNENMIEKMKDHHKKQHIYLEITRLGEVGGGCKHCLGNTT